MSLVEGCKTVPGDIFGSRSDSRLKWLGNLLISNQGLLLCVCKRKSQNDTLMMIWKAQKNVVKKKSGIVAVKISVEMYYREYFSQ